MGRVNKASMTKFHNFSSIRSCPGAESLKSYEEMPGNVPINGLGFTQGPVSTHNTIFISFVQMNPHSLGAIHTKDSPKFILYSRVIKMAYVSI